MVPHGSTASDHDDDDDENLDGNSIYCLPRDPPEAEEVVIQLKKSGYNVIREDASFTVFAPPEGCPSREKLQAEVRLKPSQAEADVVRDVRERSTACGNHFTFRLNSPLTKQPGQSVQQTLAMEGLFRTLKVKDTDTSEWARVELLAPVDVITNSSINQFYLKVRGVFGVEASCNAVSELLNLILLHATDENHAGYFVDCVEIDLRPSWEDASTSCRYAPEVEEIPLEETTMVQHEKDASWSLTFAKSFGATVGGGSKNTTGIQQKTVKSPCMEQWVVIDSEDGSVGTCYKWEMNYWQNGERTSLGLPPFQRGTVLAFPSVPETKMFAKKASVDWVWPSHTRETGEQPLEWRLAVKARAVFLTQKKFKKKFFQIRPQIVEIEPSIMLIHGESVLQLTSKQDGLPKSVLYCLFSIFQDHCAKVVRYIGLSPPR
ncbi:unnamed protein product [Sphagnum jensenii]|uniref:Uncharacterized protein n=1 Tax=Sphagnum jensenii TaxID=128206 RepID=A0ABP1AMR3_9BRYO